MTVFPDTERRLAEVAEQLAAAQASAQPVPAHRSEQPVAEPVSAQPGAEQSRAGLTLPRRPRRPRRGWHVGPVAAVLAIATLGGVAYAASGLWQPQLGDGDPDRVQVAVAGTADEGFTSFLAILRRAQTEEDRGPGSRYALRFPHQQAGILTDQVRLLGTVPGSGAALVLVPTRDVDPSTKGDRASVTTGSGDEHAAGEESEAGGGETGTSVPGRAEATARTPAAAEAPDPDQLCLWVADTSTGDGGGRTCARPGDIERGKLSLTTIEPPKESPELIAGRAAAMKQAERDNECFVNYPPLSGEKLRRMQKMAGQNRDERGRCKGYMSQSPSTGGEAATWIAVVPDGVTSVRLGDGKKALTTKVTGNLALIQSDERTIFGAMGSPDDVHWLDASGTQVGPKR